MNWDFELGTLLDLDRKFKPDPKDHDDNSLVERDKNSMLILT